GWRDGAEPPLEGHRAGADRGDGRYPARRDESGHLDGALPHRRTPRERHDALVHGRGIALPGAGVPPPLSLPRKARRPMFPSPPLLDVLIIGAGQAGLAMGRELQRSGLDILLTDAHARVGDSWRKRFDSLVLFTPRAYSALPGLALQGDPEGYPTRVEIADYLESYAAHFRLPVRTGTRIARLEQADNLFQAIVEGGEMIRARAVVVATG